MTEDSKATDVDVSWVGCVAATAAVCACVLIVAATWAALVWMATGR